MTDGICRHPLGKDEQWTWIERCIWCFPSVTVCPLCYIQHTVVHHPDKARYYKEKKR
jgi:hypothetical protein